MDQFNTIKGQLTTYSALCYEQYLRFTQKWQREHPALGGTITGESLSSLDAELATAYSTARFLTERILKAQTLKELISALESQVIALRTEAPFSGSATNTVLYTTYVVFGTLAQSEQLR